MAKKDAVEEVTEAPVDPTEAPVSTSAPRPRKLAKSIEGRLVTIEVLGQGAEVYDFASLPAEIQAKLGPFGLASKLGDAAAGKDGAESVEAIKKVFEGMLAGDWTVRAAAAPKVTISSIKENLAKLSDGERAAAEALLAGLGVKL
jgi:hypothetical protein